MTVNVDVVPSQVSADDAVCAEHALVERFVSLYQRLNKDNLHLLSEIYSEDIEFSDPLHQVSGLPALTQYFAAMYHNVASIKFDIHQVIHAQGAATLQWTMTFTHGKLNGGQPISLEGVSMLALKDKVYRHQDFFDLGSMLYEHIPLIGSLVKRIKARASQ